MAKYTIGIDYGSQSGRAVLVDVKSGKEVATAAKEYTHGVMDETYMPTLKNVEVYEQLYEYFGRENNVMKTSKRIKNNIS